MRRNLPIKRILVICLCALICVAMWNVAMLLSAHSSKVSAGTTLSTDLSKFTTTCNDGTAATSKNKLTVSGNARASFVSVSDYKVDFSKSFAINGELADTAAYDGLTITFQPNKGYAYDTKEGYAGSSLGVYNIQGVSTYAKNGLVAEFDTYDSSKYGSDTDVAGKIGTADIIPHMAIATTNASGTEALQDAAKITSGTSKVTVRWVVTDSAKGIGDYTVTCGDKSVTYRDFDPEKHFCSTEAYLCFTGAVDFNKDSTPWSFTMDSIEYNVPDVEVSEASSLGSGYAKGNQTITYTIKVKNNGNGDAVGVRVRRYMPNYTKFYSVDSSGRYGCVNKKEHATWFIKKLAAGDTATLTFKTVVDVCHPSKYKPSSKVYYEVTGSPTAPYTNTSVDPSQVTN